MSKETNNIRIGFDSIDGLAVGSSPMIKAFMGTSLLWDDSNDPPSDLGTAWGPLDVSDFGFAWTTDTDTESDIYAKWGILTVGATRGLNTYLVFGNETDVNFFVDNCTAFTINGFTLTPADALKSSTQVTWDNAVGIDCSNQAQPVRTVGGTYVETTNSFDYTTVLTGTLRDDGGGRSFFIDDYQEAGDLTDVYILYTSKAVRDSNTELRFLVKLNPNGPGPYNGIEWGETFELMNLKFIANGVEFPMTSIRHDGTGSNTFSFYMLAPGVGPIEQTAFVDAYVADNFDGNQVYFEFQYNDR